VEIGGSVCQVVNERIDGEALETRSNNNYGKAAQRERFYGMPRMRVQR